MVLSPQYSVLYVLFHVSYKKWISLTEHITPVLLEHLCPLNGKIYSATPFHSEPSTTESRRAAAAAAAAEAAVDLSLSSGSKSRRVARCRGENEDDDPRLPHMSPIPGSVIRFTSIPVWNVAPDGSSPAEISRLGMDHSNVIKTLKQSYPSELTIDQAILGEVQFAFVCFLIGQVNFSEIHYGAYVKFRGCQE